MIRRNFVKSALTVALTVATTLACSSAFAQAWPNKPVRIVVPFPAGGTTDVVARILGQRLQEAWGVANGLWLDSDRQPAHLRQDAV